MYSEIVQLCTTAVTVFNNLNNQFGNIWETLFKLNIIIIIILVLIYFDFIVFSAPKFKKTHRHI